MIIDILVIVLRYLFNFCHCTCNEKKMNCKNIPIYGTCTCTSLCLYMYNSLNLVFVEQMKLQNFVTLNV